jgi:hypothetical protein
MRKRVQEWLDAMDLIELLILRLAMFVTFAIGLLKYVKEHL